MRPNDPSRTIELIGRSEDKEWLVRFRHNMVKENALDIVAALDRRLVALSEEALRLSVGSSRSSLSLADRVEEALRVYELFLVHKHAGKRIRAGYSRRMITVLGPKGAVERTVMKSASSTGFDLLRQFNRLDCSYEQIVIDFPDEFGPEVVLKAQHNLAVFCSRA